MVGVEVPPLFCRYVAHPNCVLVLVSSVVPCGKEYLGKLTTRGLKLSLPVDTEASLPLNVITHPRISLRIKFFSRSQKQALGPSAQPT